MLPSLSLAVALLAATPPLEMEYRATEHIVEGFRRAGLPAPSGDVGLNAAAQKLARTALDASAGDASDMSTVAEAVSDASGWDAHPRAFIIRGTPPEAALDSLLSSARFSEEPASHIGVGVAQSGDRAAFAVLLARRRAQLQPFPRALAKAGAAERLCGSLVAPLHDPSIYMTQPNGHVDKLQPQTAAGEHFCVNLSFPAVGRYGVEVVGRGPSGPDVAALFFADVGGRSPTLRAPLGPEPTTVVDGRRSVLARINALREADGLAPLLPDETLNRVAQVYSEEMSDEHFFGHITPKGIVLRQRLKSAQYDYDQAGENLGMAAGPLAAHFGIEQSPGHRMTLLDPAYSRAGVGVAFRKTPTGTEAFVTELFAHPSRQASVTLDSMHQTEWFDLTTRVLSSRDDGPAPLDGAYDAFNRERRAHKLPALSRNAVLQQVASARAEASSAGADGRLTSADLAFAQAHGLSEVQLEVVRTKSPEDLERARCSSAATADAVGLGVVHVPDAPDAQAYDVVLVTAATR